MKMFQRARRTINIVNYIFIFIDLLYYLYLKFIMTDGDLILNKAEAY